MIDASPSDDTSSPAGHRDRRGIARQIADYVVATRGEPVAEGSREAALRCILDLLGAAGAGSFDPGTTAVRQTALSMMGGGAAPVWFTDHTASTVGAAWANSAAAAALDLDDGHRMARGHPGAAVIPAVFAMAQETGALATDIVAAIVIGYEVGVTIAAARRTYGNTGTWSAYAVVAAAGALRQTPADVIEHALAIAGESAPNQAFASAPTQTPPPEGSDVKEGIAWSVVTGLMALGLAEAGHTGPRNILDSDLHYKFPADLALGSALHICRTYFKLYACCRHVHAPVDALLQLMAEHAIDPGSIEAITVETYGGALRIANSVSPTHLVDVQYSIPYCLGLVAVAGPLSLLPLAADALGRDDATAIARRVSLKIDPALDACFPKQTLARLTVISAGRRLVSAVTAPRGEASDPLTWEQIEQKFAIVTARSVGAAKQAAILRGIADLRAGNEAPLMAVLASEIGT